MACVILLSRFCWGPCLFVVRAFVVCEWVLSASLGLTYCWRRGFVLMRTAQGRPSRTVSSQKVGLAMLRESGCTQVNASVGQGDTGVPHAIGLLMRLLADGQE